MVKADWDFLRLHDICEEEEEGRSNFIPFPWMFEGFSPSVEEGIKTKFADDLQLIGKVNLARLAAALLIHEETPQREKEGEVLEMPSAALKEPLTEQNLHNVFWEEKVEEKEGKKSLGSEIFCRTFSSHTKSMKKKQEKKEIGGES